MESIIGSVQLFSFDFTPEGWLPCHGQEFNTTQHEQLFSLIGFTYGGEGRSFYKIPDLRGKSPSEHMQYYICFQGQYPNRT